MKINIALIILFSQIHFMGVSAQKVTYIHFIHGPLIGNKENDYVGIQMDSKSKDIIFYEAGKKHKRKPQNQYSKYFYTLEKDTIIKYSDCFRNIPVKDKTGKLIYGKLPFEYMLYVEFADGSIGRLLMCPFYPIDNKNLYGRDLYWNNLRMLLKTCFPKTD